jgi:hypothetical protein
MFALELLFHGPSLRVSVLARFMAQCLTGWAARAGNHTSHHFRETGCGCAGLLRQPGIDVVVLFCKYGDAFAGEDVLYPGWQHSLPSYRRRF